MVSHIYNLPQVIYVNYMGYEWLIKKI